MDDTFDADDMLAAVNRRHAVAKAALLDAKREARAAEKAAQSAILDAIFKNATLEGFPTSGRIRDLRRRVIPDHGDEWRAMQTAVPPMRYPTSKFPTREAVSRQMDWSGFGPTRSLSRHAPAPGSSATSNRQLRRW